MDKAEIYEWLKSQKYQTGYDEVGEYVMYYSVDMPRILEDYYEYKVEKLNKPAVMHRCFYDKNKTETVDLKYTGEFYDSLINKEISISKNKSGGDVVVGIHNKKQ